MWRRRLIYLGLGAVLIGPLAGCAFSNSSMGVREVASSARIYVEVKQDTIMARGVRDDVAGKLKENLLSTKQGVPVNSRETADLVIEVEVLDVNFTHATKWEWNVYDSSGAVVLAKADTSAFGASGEAIATQVIAALGEIDTMAYSGGATPAVRVAAKPAQSSTAEFPQSNTDGSNSWAVVIGIENYRESLPAASGAERDAQAFAALVQQTLNVPEANIKVLTGERASKADISAALFEWLPRNAVQKGGRVYVFFSGHGAPDVENGTSFLVPYDGNPTYIRSGGIQVAEVQGALSNLKGQDAYLFLDSCFSGTGDRSVLPEGTRPLVPVKELEGGSVFTFTASGARETTGAHPESGHGLFTHYLLDGMKGLADANNDGNVNVSELKGFVVDNVKVEARRQNREQTPSLLVPASKSGSTVVQGLQP